MRIRVDSDFRFVGVVPFQIRDVAAGERFLFAEVAGDTVVRLIVAQFEEILQTSNEIYRNSFNNAPTLAGLRFRQNAFAFSHSEAAAENPTGEGALTEQYLRSRGLQLADEVMAWRFLTVPDAARKHELIVFYIEPLGPVERVV